MRSECLSSLVSILESGSRPKGGVQEGSEGVLSLGAEHLDGMGGFNFGKSKRIPDEYFSQMKKGRVACDDILVVKDGATTGKTSFVGPAFPSEPAAVNEHVFIVRVDPERANPAYVFRYLASPQGQLQMLSDFRGATVGGISRRFMDRVTIPLPPLPEQRRIAAILDKADGICRKRRQTLELADQFLRSAFLDMFGDPVTNPKGWSVKKLGEVVEIQGGVQVTSKRRNNPIEVPYLRVANVYRDALDLTEVKTIRVTAMELRRATLETADVLIVEGHGNRDEVGRSAVWDGSVDPCVHQNHLIRVRSADGVLAAQFLSFYLNSSGGRRQMFRSGKTTSGLNTISTRNVKETKVLLPPIEEQEEFVRLRAETTQARHCLESGIATAERMSTSLTQRAFRGEV